MDAQLDLEEVVEDKAFRLKINFIILSPTGGATKGVLLKSR
jgi:hypothetical protein